MNRALLAAERIQSLDISLSGLAVGTLVRTPGDYNAFNLLPAYRSLNNPPVFSLSLRSADGSLRRDPKPIRGALPPFFANLLPEEKLREAMEKHHAASVRPGNVRHCAPKDRCVPRACQPCRNFAGDQAAAKADLWRAYQGCACGSVGSLGSAASGSG
ncbi:HipA-like protein [Bradyrhizobium sp. USDA 10063]